MIEFDEWYSINDKFELNVHCNGESVGINIYQVVDGEIRTDLDMVVDEHINVSIETVRVENMALRHLLLHFMSQSGDLAKVAMQKMVGDQVELHGYKFKS